MYMFDIFHLIFGLLTVNNVAEYQRNSEATNNLCQKKKILISNKFAFVTFLDIEKTIISIKIDSVIDAKH